MGRHSAPVDYRRRAAKVALAGASALVIAGGVYSGVRSGQHDPPPGDAVNAAASSPPQAPACTVATVLAPADILPVVQSRAATVTGTDGCRRVAVVEGGAGAIADAAGHERPLPHGWISDSPSWNGQIAPALATAKVVTTTGPALATTPVVLAVPAAIAGPATTGVRPWMAALSAMPLASAPPSDNTATALAFVAVWQQLKTNPIAGAAMGDAFFRIIRESHPQSELLAQSGAGSKAFPASEQQLASLVVTRKAQALRAMVPAEGTPSLDYRLTRLGSPDAAATQALDSLEAALRDEQGVAALRAAGFRVDGRRGVDVPDVPADLTPAPVDQGEFDKLIRDWSYINRDLRTLMVVDVSGSMLATAGQTRRIDLAVDAVQQAVHLMKPTSQAGLWVFSTAQRGRLDYRPVVAVRPLGPGDDATGHAAALVREAAKMPSFVGGDTGLNDTIYAAFATMQRSYQPDRDNLVVVLTDGRNDDSTGGLSTDQLIARLRADIDPARPVRVVVVGMGTAGEQAVMEKVTRVVGGHAAYVTDAQGIPAAFAGAIWRTNRDALR